MANQTHGKGCVHRGRDDGDEERFASRERERMGSQWDDRSARWDDREERNRGRGRQERYVGGEVYGAGYLAQGGQQMGYRDDPYTDRYSRPMGGHRGKGPVGYTRSDERIREIVCEVLTDDDMIDATHIEVEVHGGEVTLSGTVEERSQKRMAEDRIENLSCVKDVVNQLRVRRSDSPASSSTRREAARDHSETPSSSDKRHRA